MNTAQLVKNHIDTDSIKQLLRLQDEPFVHISDPEIHTILMTHASELMDLFKHIYIEWGQNEEAVYIPKKKVIQTPGLKGDFRVMPCITTLHGGIKAVKVIGTNEENKIIKDKISVGKTLLLDWHDNYVTAILDTCVLSSYRTAAISLLAYSLTEDQQSQNIGIVGTGRIGFYTAFLLHSWLGIKHINYCDPNPQIIKNFQTLASIYMPELTINSMTEDEIIKDSDALFLATDSQIPILNAANTEHLTFISSVGADADNLSELHESMIDKYQIITDSIQSMMLGDMSIWEKNDYLSQQDVVVLKDIINTPNPLSGHTLFISTGVAIQDAIITQFVINKFKDDNSANQY